MNKLDEKLDEKLCRLIYICRTATAISYDSIRVEIKQAVIDSLPELKDTTLCESMDELQFHIGRNAAINDIKKILQ